MAGSPFNGRWAERSERRGLRWRRVLQEVYDLPGDRVRSLDDFFRVMGEVVNGPGGYFGSNHDGLIDCLRGGFGTPDEGSTIRWLRSDQSRDALGYPETIRHLKLRLSRCYPTGRDETRRDLARARRHEGPTVFDWLVEIIHQALVSIWSTHRISGSDARGYCGAGTAG